jgi:hypothetical protein
VTGSSKVQLTQSPAKIGRWVNVDAAKPKYLTATERANLTATGYRTR